MRSCSLGNTDAGLPKLGNFGQKLIGNDGPLSSPIFLLFRLESSGFGRSDRSEKSTASAAAGKDEERPDKKG